jgi:hypothetical protein
LLIALAQVLYRWLNGWLGEVGFKTFRVSETLKVCSCSSTLDPRATFRA